MLNLKEKVSLLPHTPGVYRFLNSDGTVIYVGKAKDLHRRVAQYFRSPESLNTKTRVMVSKIADMMHTVVATEEDALLLENNLIKQLQPRYNILLKDSKTYPWICIKKEPFPRVVITRTLNRDGSKYFGPYSSVQHAHALMDLIGQVYRLRTCKLRLNPESIEKGKFKKCLNAHIGKCDAPCIAAISQEEYDAQIAKVESLLKGGVREQIRENRDKMMEAAAELRFEDAHIYKERMQMLEKHYASSPIVNSTDTDTDIFSLINEGQEYFCNFMRIRGGCIIQSFSTELEARIEEEKETVLATFIAEMIVKFGELSKEVIVPFVPDNQFENVNFTVPQRGGKAALLELSRRNAAACKAERYKHEEKVNPDAYKEMVLESLQRDLGMKVLPRHMECFDNSNTQGTNPVAACVVFRDGKPSKKEYRHFNIKTVVGANDYASMKEIVNRRYSRMLAEGEPLPDLIVIDGGKGQLHFAIDALQELGIADQVHIIGLAERLEEVVRADDPYPLFLDKNSSSLKVLMHIRDEAHRFGITFHRSKRGKAMLTTSLTSIKGIGEATAEKLLAHFKGITKIKNATFAELAEVVGPRAAKLVYNHYNQPE